MPEAHCFQCHKALALPERISRREECVHCGADLHSCMQCVFYDRGAYNECREPVAERVQVKDRSNHCDFFQLRTTGLAVDPNAAKDKLRAAAEALFKKKENS